MAQKKQDQPKVEEFMEIGGSPAPGMILRTILRGHTDIINRIAWSPGGRYLASPSDDETIRIWDMELGECIKVLEGHSGWVSSVEWSPNGQRIASASQDRTVIIWNAKTGKIIHRCTGHEDMVYCAIWSPDGDRIVSAADDNTLRVWHNESGNLLIVLRGHEANVIDAKWSQDGSNIVSASRDNTIRIWDPKTGTELHRLSGHNEAVFNIAWMPGRDLLASGSADKTVRIWSLSSLNQIAVLEGAITDVIGISFSEKGKLLAAKSSNSVQIWRCDYWEMVNEIPEISPASWISGLSFHPRAPMLATLSENDTVIRIWDIDYNVVLGYKPAIESIRYTTAKIVLVGDSGVGKTGLGWRLAYDEFKEQSSTHGQQFWVIPELGIKRDDGTECEAVLWDLAGQPDYRLVHSLFLDDVDTALVLFDPTNRQEPLSGVDFWLNQLKRRDKELCNSILVGARSDRGTSTLTEEELQAYCERNDICGGCILTSALTGEGLLELQERLKTQIPWNEMTATVTTVTFKRIKDFVLSLKEKTDRKSVLVSPMELREMLQISNVFKDSENSNDSAWRFTSAEMMTAVGHLANHGYVTVLRGSQGQQSILLAPNLLANLASSIVLEARRNPRGLGVLEENRLLHGEYYFPELHNLSQNETDILLDAAAVLFLERNLCFRETFNQQTFLVFPSLINEKRPLDKSLKTVEGPSYQARGAVENVYASLVVLLGYTNTFIRTHQWQNQAQYEMGEGEICGFQQTDNRDGEIELVLYYGEYTPEPVRTAFRGLFERFLCRRELEISRYQPIQCNDCGSFLARNVVLAQLGKGKRSTFCHECGKELTLPDPEPVTRLSRPEEVILDAQQAVAQRRTAFEAALVRVKALLRDHGEEKKPTCFISYAWGIPENERWVLQLAKDLRNAGVDVLFDKWHCKPGDDLGRYIDQIESSQFVVVVGTPELKEKYASKTDDRVIATELELINLRASQPKVYGRTTLPLLLAGDAKTSIPPQLQRLVSIDFRQGENYFRKLIDVIWRLYDLPFDNPLLEELQSSMSPQRM